MALPPVSPLSSAPRHAPAQVKAGARDLEKVRIYALGMAGLGVGGCYDAGEGAVSVTQVWGMGNVSL